MEVRFPGPEGVLEGLLERPEGRARAAAAVAHPHPEYGGTMRNTIVHRVAKGLRAAGVATLRFDFRGVEGSAGSHHGRGGPGSEEDDVAAALDLLAREHPGVPLLAAGFSFGARTVCGLSLRDPRIRRLFLVALPVRIYGCEALALVDRPTYVLMGGADEFGTPADLRARFPSLPPHVLVEEVEGADHFFRGRTPEVEERVRAAAERALEEEER